MKTLHIFYFDCWKRDGRIKTKTIYAADEGDANILFKGKYPEYAFDPPYGSWTDTFTTHDFKTLDQARDDYYNRDKLFEHK